LVSDTEKNKFLDFLKKWLYKIGMKYYPEIFDRFYDPDLIIWPNKYDKDDNVK